jgi:Ca2+-binding EF-hand superfamily protein
MILHSEKATTEPISVEYEDFFVGIPKSHLELSEAFREFDGDGDGLIDFAQFACLLSSLQFVRSHAQALEAFRLIDIDRDQAISFGDFLPWWRSK